MKRLAAFMTACLLGMSLAFTALFPGDGQVELARLDATNWKSFAPDGKEVDAIYGDFVIRNRHIVAVVAQPIDGRNANMTVRDVGGCLIDLTVRASQSDQLSAFYPGARRYAYRYGAASTTNGNVDLSQGTVVSDEGQIIVRSSATEKLPAVEVTYRLATDSEFLVVVSRFINESKQMMEVPLFDDVRIDAQKDDIVKSPNGTSDLFWFHDRFWKQAGGFEAVGFRTVTNSNSRTTNLQYETKDGDRSIRLKPGEDFTLIRRIFPGTDLPHVRSISASIRGMSTSPVEFAVLDGVNRAIPDARVHLKRGAVSWGTILTDQKGIASTSLPAGEYSAAVEALGVDITPGSPTFLVRTASDRQRVRLVCDAWKPGTVDARIVDARGEPIPCKVDFYAKGSTPQPWFGPETADFGVKGLRYAPLGEFSQSVPAGKYEVVISHGPEFDAVFTELIVPPGKSVELRAELERVVDTTGWVSSDFHSHSSPSGDNTGSQLGRVLNLVCDHIEFAPCTEHNRIDSYQPHIDSLKIGRFINSCSGMELTGSPLLLNHQNAFPLKYRPHLQDGGGPVTDGDVETQVERLALWDGRSEKLVQQNHPDLGWLMRDRNGDGMPDEGHLRIIPHLDVIEIHPVPDILTLDPFKTVSSYKGNNRIFNWLQLLNQGYRFVGVVNSDAHYNYHESGWIRNWIRSPVDDPSEIKTLDIVRASEAGAVVMSNGPFLDVRISEAGDDAIVICGQGLEAKSGSISVDVSVQCPNWCDIDRVFVLVNGRIDSQHHYRKASHPDKFRSGVVRFQEKLTVNLTRDSHVIVVAGGEESQLGVVHGPVWGKHSPAAFINPVYVDVDGNGFEPNGDTLDHPLPVRFGYPKR